MNYHINTMLIIDSYKKIGECPICDIAVEAQSRLIEQFSGEAVMIEEYRKKVNAKGFCEKHFCMLSETSNKLGVALQLSTRMLNIHAGLHAPVVGKSIEKQSSNILACVDSCVICDMMSEIMDMYYAGVCKLYASESEFREIFANGRGHCLRHYAMLLKYSHHAKKYQQQFLQDIFNMQDSNMKRMIAEVDWFCDKFDYRNKDKPMGNSADSIKRGIQKLFGKK